jgi:flagellar assembly protein FliH
MADLSPLLSRGTARFARDTRFDAADTDVPVPELALTPPPVDPLAEARTAGFAAGRAEALAQADAKRGIGEKFALSLARLDAERTETLRQQLIDTVVALCEATLAPLALDVAALARRVERTVAMFARADDERVIRLNPDDQAAIRGMLPSDWIFLPDPALARGALRVETPSGGAEDGPEHWRRAIAEALESC